MTEKKDHKDCWNNQYDQNNQHMKYVVTPIILPYVDQEFNYSINFAYELTKKER